MKWRSLTKWCLLALLLFPQTWVYAQDAGYEAAKGGGSCPTEGGYNPPHGDPWGFFRCECTSYVAYRLRLNNVKHNGTLFTNTAWGVQWSDAYKWGDTNKLDQVGVRKDKHPAVGSVAYWTKGHVAYVQHIFTNKADGSINGIGIMEYNWADCPAPQCSPDHKYRYRRIGHGNSGYPDFFLHFEEKGTDATNTNVTCASKLTNKPSGAHQGTFCWKHNGSNGSCSSASAYNYFDYQSCTKYTVSKSYCSYVGNNLGYTVHIGSWFPEPIDPAAFGNDFASCPSGGTAQGTSTEVLSIFPPQLATELQKQFHYLNH